MAYVKFVRGLFASYKPDADHLDAIYFATDKKAIYVNNVSYGSSEGVKDVTLEGNNLKITYSNGTTKNISINDLLIYTSNIVDKELAMPNNVGGYTKGTKVSDLEGRSYNQLWDDLLFPTVYPTFTDPSVNLSLKSFASVVKVGSTAPVYPTNFTVTFNKGAITLNGVKQNNRAGNEKTEESFIYSGGKEANKPETPEFPTKVALGNTIYNYKLYYEAGPQPLDNKGNPYQTALSAGFKVSNNLNVNGTFPYYATTSNISNLAEQSLIAWSTGTMTTPRIKLAAETDADRQKFKIPRKCTQLLQLNTNSGKDEVVSLSEWDEATSTENINGVEQTYYTYTYKGNTRGPVDLTIKF